MATVSSSVSPQEQSLVDAIWSIIQNQTQSVREAIFKKVADEQLVMTTNEDLVHRLGALDPGPLGFLKLDSILPPSSASTDELLNEFYPKSASLNMLTKLSENYRK